MSKAQMHRRVMRRHVLGFPPDQEELKYEKEVEARLGNLTELVESFGNSTLNYLLAEKTAVRELVEELIVKEAALSWIVRIAKYSESPIRERLWMDIDAALTDLEETADSVRHAGMDYTRTDGVDRRARVIPIRQHQ